MHFTCRSMRGGSRFDRKRNGSGRAPEGSSLECLMRPPLAADRSSQGLLLPWRIGATMRDDHVAAVPMVHWPSPVASWYADLRRVATYSPVLGRWTTLNDFFHLTDRPYETFRPEPDGYATPYLAQAVAQRASEPVSRLARHHRFRRRLEAARMIQGLARALASSAAGTPAGAEMDGDIPPLEGIEDGIERHGPEVAATALDRALPAWAKSLTRLIVGAGSAGIGRRRGYLVTQPPGRAPTCRRSPARCGARPASRGAAPRRAVHGRGGVRRR